MIRMAIMLSCSSCQHWSEEKNKTTAKHGNRVCCITLCNESSGKIKRKDKKKKKDKYEATLYNKIVNTEPPWHMHNPSKDNVEEAAHDYESTGTLIAKSLCQQKLIFQEKMVWWNLTNVFGKNTQSACTLTRAGAAHKQTNTHTRERERINARWHKENELQKKKIRSWCNTQYTACVFCYY